MNVTMRSKTKHIDEVQPSTVEEHFRVLIADEDTIDYDASEEVTSSDLPEWYDEELFQAGQEYYSSNRLGLTVTALTGLISMFAIPSILKVLTFTKQSGVPCTAFRRYFQTVLHTDTWYSKDAKDKNSDWYRTTNTVRWKHSNSSRRSICSGSGGITHRDMALTQFGFIGYALIKPDYLGLTNTPKEREGLNHFWRVLGHMLGISDRLNICRKTAAETTQLCRKLQDQVFGENLKEPPPNFEEMVEAMLDGLWSMDMAIDSDTVPAFTYKLNDLPYHKPLSLHSWLNLKYREAIHQLSGTPYIGKIVRLYFKYYLSFIFWMSENYPVVGWIRWGKEESKIKMYPKLK